MPYTYPPAAPSISGDNVTISRFLNDPALVQRRLRTLLEQRYIADTLLSGRYAVAGGAVQYETGESIFAKDDPRAVSPGAEYPLTTLSNGTAQLAKTSKWGEDALITDESIARQKMTPVTRAMTKLVNSNVKLIDTIAMTEIDAKVTNGATASANFAAATAKQILKDAGTAQAYIRALNQGFEPDTIVLNDANWMSAMLAFIDSGYVPRETSTANPALTGDFPVILGMRWLVSPNLVGTDEALVLDSTQLGGMADENIGGPGYSSESAPGVEGKAIREDAEDRWRLRVRRVTVPIVVEPTAGYKIKHKSS